MFEVPRVLHRAVVAGLVGRAHGEFVHVGLAQGDHAGGGQLGDHGGVIRRLEVVEHLRAAAGAYAVGAEQVLVGDRGTQQRAGFASGATGVGGTRLAQGQVFGDADKAVDLWVELFDARQQRAGQLFGGKRLVGESAGDLGQGQLMHGRLYPLLDDFGNQVQTAFGRRRDGLVGVALVAFGDLVGTQALAGLQGVGQWLDASGVDRLHLVDQAKNTVQGIGNAWQFAIIQAQAGQMSDLFHVAAFKRHGDLQGKQRPEFGSAVRNMSAFWRSNGREILLACSEKQPI
ncbi:hypothetical protein D3C71_1420160 [compost metagenome]